MKHSGTTMVLVIVWAAVLLVALVAGICVREVRFRNAGLESKADAEPQMSAEIPKPSDTSEPERGRAEMVQVPPEMRPMPGPEGRPGQNRGGGREEMAMFQLFSPEEAAQLREKWPNMSEEEREKFRAQMREKWENMSEEEREKVMTEMRKRFGGGRPQGGGQGRRTARRQR